MKKILSLAALALCASASAFAFEATVEVVISPVYTVAEIADSTVVAPTATSASLSTDDVVAVKGAQTDALLVAQGAQPTDAFNNGKDALEKAGHVTFPTNEKAALAILDVDSQIQ